MEHRQQTSVCRLAALFLALLLCLGVLPGVVPQAHAEDAAAEKTEWQIKFAEHFTDEVVVTDHSYSSPNVSIDITMHQETIDGYPQVWYVADIYVASLDCFRCYARNNSFDRYVKVQADELAQEAGALIAINGDYCSAQGNYGFYVRNGVIYQKEQTTCDLCVLYNDGTMETYGKKDYNAPGPIWIGNPRSAIGYYEPGHYCFVMVDGRQQKTWSRGFTLEQLSKLFEDLGCTAAYNLDGGASATMTFMGQLYNRQSSYRKIGDILMIGEPLQEGETNPS